MAAGDFIKAADSALIVIDIQARLAPVISGIYDLTANAVTLAKFAEIIDWPVIFTEQGKLGSTLDEIRSVLPQAPVLNKMSFDSLAEPEIKQALADLNRPNLVLCGIETHICVLQTALSVLKAGYGVQVVTDAVGSRNPANRDIALRRLEAAGVTLTTTEMVIYELLERAGTDQFRQVLELVK